MFKATWYYMSIQCSSAHLSVHVRWWNTVSDIFRVKAAEIGDVAMVRFCPDAVYVVGMAKAG
jgi:hypothetical protein